jgi:hypothetical protein
MQFTVPQFIEKKPKIVGPFTFSQFIYIGLAGGFCLFIYFVVPFWSFILISLLLIPLALALAFLKIGGTSLPVFLKNSFLFFLAPKIYLWKKKTSPPLFKKIEKIEKEKEEKSPLKLAEKSRLRDLFTQLETRR